MTLKQLEYFSQVYEHGNLTKASQSLYISQQALSRILSSLEQELGNKLFDRTHKGLQPTALGRELYAAAQPVLQENTRLNEHIGEFIRSASGHLNIGLAAGARYLNTRHLWSEFQRQYPKVSISVEEISYLNGEAQLKSRNLDLLTFSDYQAGEDYIQRDLKTWNRALIVPEGHSLYHCDHPSLSDLKGERIFFCANPMVYQNLLQVCSQNHCQPEEIIRVSDTLYMYEACQTEKCIGITIEGYFSNIFLPMFGDLRLLPFPEGLLPYTVTAIYRRSHPMAKILSALADAMKVWLKNPLN